jgi:molybdate transport system substrate-binding protein
LPTILRPRRALLATLATLTLLGVGCAGDDDPEIAAPTTTRPTDGGRPVRQPALEGTLTIFAAETLEPAMGPLVEAFRQENPELVVDVRTGPSAVLGMEVADGAAADLFIASDLFTMAMAAGAERTESAPLIAARNSLVIVTAPGNPTAIADVADLATAERVARCAPPDPCATFTDRLFDTAGVTVPESATSTYPTAGEALAAVRSGEASAAVTFATTAAEAGDAVTVVPIPEGNQILTNYLVAPLLEGNLIAARAFIDFLRSSGGQEILIDNGFLPMPS